VPAAAEAPGDGRYIQGIGRATCDKLDVAIELHQHEDRRWLVQLAQLVGQRGDLVHRRARDGGRQQDGVPLDHVRLGAFQQALVQLALLRRQAVSQELAHHVQIGPAVEQPGGAARVAGGRRAIEQRAGILVDAEQQQRRLERHNADLLGVNLLDKQRGRRPHRIAGEGVVGFQVAGERVVVNEMHRRLRAHPARRGEALRVHDGDALDRRAAPQIAPPDEG